MTILRRLTGWFARFDAASFFVVGAVIINAFYLYHLSPLRDYGHGAARFFHIVHMANSLLGKPQELPVSMVEMLAEAAPGRVRGIMKAPCREWPSNVRFYCETPLAGSNPSFLQLIDIPLDPARSFGFTPNWTATLFSPMGYFPYLLPALAGIWLEWTPIVIMYVSVLGNALVIIALGFYTIRMFPVMRLPVCYVLLTPMAAMSRIYFMPDALAIDLCLLMLAVALRLKYNPQPLTRWAKAGILILSALVGLIKVCYLLVPLILLLAPGHVFGSGARAKWWMVAGCVAVSLAASLLWAGYVEKTQGILYGSVYSAAQLEGRNGNWQDPRRLSGRIYDVVSQPVTFLMAIYGDVARKYANPWHLNMMLTSNHKWLSPFNTYLTLAPLLLLPLFALEATGQGRVSWRGRLFIFGLLLACIGVIYITRYLYIVAPLSWHEKLHFYILERYFTPIIIMLPMVWHSLINIPLKARRYLLPASYAFVIYCLFVLHQRQMIFKVQIF